MSGLQNFLTPFSHLVFANRDKVIVVLGLILAWLILWLLIARWRNERLLRELAAAKSSSSSGGSRRYVTHAAPVEEAQAEAGPLPPVKGGRSYARNLGSALQKAGMAPQIYSPPSAPSWAQSASPSQASMGQPSPPYAPQNVPWAAPAATPGSPWGGYPGAGRGTPGAAPGPVPLYQPPQQSPAQPYQTPQPIAPPPGVPGPYGPPAGSPFAPSTFTPATSGPSAPAPSFAPPSAPTPPAIAPAFGPNPPATEPAAADPSSGDAGRRGKPKRRRFNFNVLENLEKMVQPKAAEPAPPTGWTPPVTPAPTAGWIPPAGAPPTTSWTPPASAPAPTPAPPAPAAPAAQPTPEPSAAVEAEPIEEADASAHAEEATTEAPSLPLHFGPPAEPEADADASLPLRFGPEKEAEPEQATSIEKEAEPEPEPIAAEAPAAEPEPQPEPEPEPVPEARGSMRSMLFGEEVVSTHDAEPVAEAKPVHEPVASEQEPAAAEQPRHQRASAPEPTTEAPELEKYRPWNTTPIWEPEPQPETVAATEPAEVPEVPTTPTAGGSDQASAGTVVIIEDDPSAATYYSTLFRGNGYRVEVASDGVSGVDLCTRLQPQLIMLDVMMPRQNGILVLQTLRASDETKNTPVVVMSNFSEPTLIKRAIQLGALEYVIKTQVEGPALLSAVPRWMNHEKAFAAA